MATCKGRKKDGTPCRSPIVLDNGYCRAHQDQALQATAPEELVRWTRERLEAAIAAHGGPDGLDLAGDDLSDLKLNNMDLHGVVLSRHDKVSDTLLIASLRWTRLVRANLQGAIMFRVDLRDTHLMGADLQGANMWGADLRGTNLPYANLQKADLRQADLQGTNLRYADLRGVDLLDVKSLQGIMLYRARLEHTRLRRESLEPGIWEEQKEIYRNARDAYLALKQNFEGLGDYDAASWAYRKERRMEKLEKRKEARRAFAEHNWRVAIANYAKFAMDQFVECLCDYGEGIGRVVGWIVLTLLLIGPGLVRLTGGLEWTGRNEDIYLGLLPLWKRWGYAYLQYVLYTIDTFTTADFAELKPANDWVRLVSGFMAMFGFFLTGLLGFVAGNRIRKS